MTVFDQALAFTLREEGGYADDPADHGGATNRGITQHEYDSWRARKGLTLQLVRGLDDSEMHQIYDEDYWQPGKCPRLADALAICHFDWCVNHGVSGAIKTLQQALGVDADGVFGPATAAAATAADAQAVTQTYLELRRQWYRRRVVAEPGQSRFLKGWLARVDRLDAYLEKL